jgi:hypothetical protein
MNGQTWHKVVIGPYPTPEAAYGNTAGNAHEVQQYPWRRVRARRIRAIDKPRGDSLITNGMMDCVNRQGWANWRWRHEAFACAPVL